MKHPGLPYVLPFAIFVALLAFEGRWGVSPAIEYWARVLVLAAVLWFFSRRVISFRAPRWIASIGVGIVVFLIWIAPEALVPGWRNHFLFQNPLTGAGAGPPPPYAAMDAAALSARFLRAAVIVPIVEELFWRAWLMRWLISPHFETVKLGAWSAQAFSITAVLFALEHGSYWEVGLLAGVAYNGWMVHTRSLGDCILAHAVTNALLSAYVLACRQWQYW